MKERVVAIMQIFRTPVESFTTASACFSGPFEVLPKNGEKLSFVGFMMAALSAMDKQICQDLHQKFRGKVVQEDRDMISSSALKELRTGFQCKLRDQLFSKGYNKKEQH